MSLQTFGIYAAAFVFAFGTLVVFHELGHYLIARACGVKVLRFALGFGKTVWSRRLGRDDTEWAVAAFPLGGYVKMLDEREGPVSADELHRAFNRQTVGRRALIVLAGPVANLLLAILLYWVVFMHGVEELRPRIGQVPAGSPAAEAGVVSGATIKSVNGVAVATWQELRWEVLRSVLDRAEVNVEVEREDRTLGVHRLRSGSFNPEDLEKDPLRPLGLAPFRSALAPVIGGVAPESAAALAGLQAGDRILSIDGQRIEEWTQLAEIARASPGKVLQFELQRDHQLFSLGVTPAALDEHGQLIGRLGVRVHDDGSSHDERFITLRYGPVDSVIKATRQTWDTSVLTLRLLGRMAIGQLSWKNISGPVTIADYAGQSAQLGATHYLRFLALISISLGVLNLLPIPILDGGHLLYYLAEVIKGGPLSERVMEYGQQVGFTLLGILMTFAFYNDINRLISG